MNDNERWPGMGQAAASRTTKIIALHAGWKLVECAAHHGLPLAAFLHEEALALLVGATDGSLHPAVAVMNGPLFETRSDGIIVGRGRKSDGLPELALGLWRPGSVTWNQPLVPWLCSHGTIWLVDAVAGPPTSAFRLTTSRIRSDAAPWINEDELRAGLARASAALPRSDEKEE